MERISTYNVRADLGMVRSAAAGREIPQGLRDALQSLVQRIAERAGKKPVRVYVASEDSGAELRDYFAFALVRLLSHHVPSALLVDCAFLEAGLHGLVPEKDALGFLDLLLYGSSLGVITQERDGVKVVGAGSFPVTKKMPFVVGAFEEASRRLVHHARCVIFVGPARDDEDQPHALLGAVDVPVLVAARESAPAGAVDPLEEETARRFDADLVSVRVLRPTAAAPAAAPPPAPETFSRLVGEEAEPYEPLERTSSEEAPEPGPETPVPPPAKEPAGAPPVPPPAEELADETPAPPPAEEPAPDQTIELTPEELPPPKPAAEPEWPFGEQRGRKRRSRWVWIAVAVAAIAVLAWFGMRARSPEMEVATRPAATPPQPTRPAALVDTMALTRADSVAAETTATTAPGERAVAVAADTAVAPPQSSPEPAVGAGGQALISPQNVLVMEDLQKNWAGWFFIHISSFRQVRRAREEVAALKRLKFPVFIVFLDLGAKGKWYRVYAGPFKTRDKARDVKKSLDDVPRVRFTRITSIPG